MTVLARFLGRSDGGGGGVRRKRDCGVFFNVEERTQDVVVVAGGRLDEAVASVLVEHSHRLSEYDGGRRFDLVAIDEVSDVGEIANDNPLFGATGFLDDESGAILWKAVLVDQRTRDRAHSSDAHEEDDGLVRMVGGKFRMRSVASVPSRDDELVRDGAMRDRDSGGKRSRQSSRHARDDVSLDPERFSEFEDFFASAAKDERVADLQSNHGSILSHGFPDPVVNLFLGDLGTPRSFASDAKLASN